MELNWIVVERALAYLSRAGLYIVRRTLRAGSTWLLSRFTAMKYLSDTGSYVVAHGSHVVAQSLHLATQGWYLVTGVVFGFTLLALVVQSL